MKIPLCIFCNLTVVNVVLFIGWDFSIDCCYCALLNGILSWTHENDSIVHKINSNGYLWYHARHLSVIKRKEQEIDVAVSS